MAQSTTALDAAREVLRRRSARIAVVGASNDPSKYGNIIVNTLMRHGYEVLPVNPRRDTVAGLKAYPTLAAVPGSVDLVDVVTSPEVTKEILRDAAAAGIRLVFLQPGSFDDTVLDAAASTPFQVVHQSCIMVEAKAVAAERR